MFQIKFNDTLIFPEYFIINLVSGISQDSIIGFRQVPVGSGTTLNKTPSNQFFLKRLQKFHRYFALFYKASKPSKDDFFLRLSDFFERSEPQKPQKGLKSRGYS